MALIEKLRVPNTEFNVSKCRIFRIDVLSLKGLRLKRRISYSREQIPENASVNFLNLNVRMFPRVQKFVFPTIECEKVKLNALNAEFIRTTT